jgi:hypothetical protein
LLVVAVAVAVYGLLNNLLFLGGAVFVAGVALTRYERYKASGIFTAACGLALFAVIFFYGIGKDMALRDNALNKPAVSAPATGG